MTKMAPFPVFFLTRDGYATDSRRALPVDNKPDSLFIGPDGAEPHRSAFRTRRGCRTMFFLFSGLDGRKIAQQPTTVGAYREVESIPFWRLGRTWDS